ncbi:MAG: hypothetical protein K0S07_960 [Chlamydiales bacterium]|jgi:formylglycine-generating enzyme required for sulfatase activity|nr:hypothetical protein [Chlamydiales bacterium]
MRCLLAEFERGDLIADYEIVDAIGRGPLATTYQAKNAQGQEVALKIFKIPKSLPLEWLQSLQIETSLLSRLSSPYIDQPLASGRVQDFYFIAKDLGLGQPGAPLHLRDYLKQHQQERLSPFLAYHVIEQILLALTDALSFVDASHQGLVHGNLKPENVLICHQDTPWQKAPFAVKVSDFQPYGLISSEVISTGFKVWQETLQGSEYRIDYSIKEALQSIYSAYHYRDPLDIGVRKTPDSDVFSLGMLAYEMLSGKLPVGRYPALSDSLEIDPVWDLFINRALSPRSRFSSAFEALEFLREEISPLIEDPLADALESKDDSKESASPFSRERGSLTPKGMVYLPKSDFLVGSADCGDDASPQHLCQTEGFYIDRHLVTIAQFQQFVSETGYQTLAEKEGGAPLWVDGLWRFTPGLSWKNPQGRALPGDMQRHPVTQVAYVDCLAYVAWAEKRLPTEEEWEYAARGGQKESAYPTGDSLSASQANFSSDSTSPVMAYQANGFGLYDMAGNVWEWTSSLYEAYPGHQKNNPHFGNGYQVVRGGCWLYDASACRASLRNACDPVHCYPTVGFRCVADFSL